MGDVEKLKLLRADKMSTSNIDENEDEDRAISVDITKENFLFQGRLKRFLHIGQISQKRVSCITTQNGHLVQIRRVH